MANAQLQSDRKRVKVYELRNNDWYDRGTGFCHGQIFSAPSSSAHHPDARLIVHSENEPEHKILETRIKKSYGYLQQQQTLIVWTEPNSVDMALSFQEPEGCTSIWQFVSDIQTRLSDLAPDGNISDDDMLDQYSFGLPKPQLGRLDEVVMAIRNASSTPSGREALVKFVMGPDENYIDKLAPLVEMAEDLESTPDLHQLCTIMKHLILLNDNAIIEYVVTDEAIMGVLGALEYDPDFPSHRAAHRQFLRETSKFKEIVEFKDPEIRNKIQYTHRLLYLKDVVLARILDDPTFSVLNSLIFFHHVDIIQYITTDTEHCRQLFSIINDETEASERKKTAVLFIQNCCAVAKNIQPNNRANLYNALVSHGLFSVVAFSLRHHDASVRVAGTDILVSLIDHDAGVVRTQANKALNGNEGPLIDTLIDLLLVEVDLGVKSQMADAIKILLDQTAANAAMEIFHRQGGLKVEQRTGAGGQHILHNQHQVEHARQMRMFVQNFYEGGAKRLFQPLKDLEHREDWTVLNVQELSLYTHLIEILCFFVRQHANESKRFIQNEGLHLRISQLLRCRKKYMRLVALKWFRTCIGLQDSDHNDHFIKDRLFEPILDIVYETMPRDNLLNSACLELFEYIKRENIHSIVDHLVESYRPRLLGITYVATFQALILRYEQNHQRPLHQETENSFTTEPDTPDGFRNSIVNGRQIFSGLKEDPDEDAYFNGDDDDDDGDMIEDDELALPTAMNSKVGLVNGHPRSKAPLVDYPDDEDDATDLPASSPDVQRENKSSDGPVPDTTPPALSAHPNGEEIRGRNRTPVPLDDSPGTHRSPPESMKRRREEDDDENDELGKLMGGTKRRNSSSTLSSKTLAADTPPQFEGNDATVEIEKDDLGHSPVMPTDSPTQDDRGVGHGHTLRRKGSLKVKNESTNVGGKFSIKLNRKGHSEDSNGDGGGG